MRRVIFLALLIALICVPAYAQRGGGVENPVNLLPLCTATSGSCPAQDYFCHDSDYVVWHCNSGVWNDIVTKTLIQSTSCAAYTAESQICWDSDNDVLYIGDGTTAQPITGGGGSGTSTIQEGDATVSSAATTLDFRSGFDLTESPVGEVNISLDLTEAVTMGAAVTSSFALSSLAGGDILIYDGANSFDNKTLGTDATISSEGALTIALNAVALGADTTGNYVANITTGEGLVLDTPGGAEGATVGIIDCAANEIMKRNAGDTAWACGSDSTGSGGSPVILDIGDDGGNDSTDLTEIATNGDTNSIVTMPLADKLYMDMSANWPGADLADLATALAANGDNCSAGSFPLGVDASGAAETCTDAATQAELDAFVGSANIVTLGTVTTGTWTGTAVDATYLDTNTVLDDASNTFSTGLQVIDGDTDEIQLRIQGNATQTADIFVVEKSDGTDLFTVDNSGNSTFGGTTSAIISQAGNDLNITAAGGQSITLGDGGSANYVEITDAGVMSWTGGDVDLPNNSVDDTDVNFNYAGSSSPGGAATEVAADGIKQATDIYGSLCSTGQILKNTAGTWACAADDTGSTPAFTDIANGTNTAAAMVVSTGASLRPSGTGIVEATHLEDGAGAALTCGAGTEGTIQIGTDVANDQVSYCDSSITPTLVSGYLDADGLDDDTPEATEYTNLTGGNGIDTSSVVGTVDVDLMVSGADADSAIVESDSGLEFVGGKLTMLRGCANDEIMKWDETQDDWNCEADAGSAGGDSVSIDSVAVTDPDFVSTGDIDFVDTSNTITANINADSIVNADVNTGAAIAASKLAISATSPIALSGGGAISITDVYVNSDGDDTMVGDLTLDDTDVGTALTVRADSAAAGATVGVLITTDDDDSANFDPFEIRDDSGVNNDLLFAIDHTGTVTTGIIPLSTLATTVTVTDNESTAENNPLVFVAGGALTGGDLGLESDGTTYYTPSTGVITATGFAGALTGTASLATTVTVSDDESTNDEQEIVFTTDNTNLKSDGTMTYNPSTGTITATEFVGGGSGLTGVLPTFSECFTLYDVDGLAATADLPSIWRAPAAVTITDAWCETDVAAASTITLEKDGGNDLTTACSCTSTPAACSLTATGADKAYADGVLLDFVFVTAGASVARLNFCFEYTYD